MSHGTPYTAGELKPRQAAFEAFLRGVGAEVQVPTSEYELLRFTANGQTSIVYRRRHNGLTWTGESEQAWRAFCGTKPWRAGKKPGRSKSARRILALLRRDGHECFFCGDAIPEGQETEEHLVPLGQGGPTRLANLALAHGSCNAKAGHLPVVAKVRLRDRMRAARTKVSP